MAPSALLGHAVAASALPEGSAAGELFELYLLPDERLLTRVSGPIPGPGWSWQLLAPSPDLAGAGLSGAGEPGAGEPDGRLTDAGQPTASRWCMVPGAALPSSGMPLRVAGDRLWWLSSPGQPASLALANLACAEPSSGASVPARP